LNQMPGIVFTEAVVNGLKRCNEILQIGLKEEELLRTTYYRPDKPQS
jgi:hypothetical protein